MVSAYYEQVSVMIVLHILCLKYCNSIVVYILSYIEETKNRKDIKTYHE